MLCSNACKTSALLTVAIYITRFTTKNNAYIVSDNATYVVFYKIVRSRLVDEMGISLGNGIVITRNKKERN
jgi:hypothetical protein